MHALLGTVLMLAAAPAAAHPYAVEVDPGRVSHGQVTGEVDLPLEQALAVVMDCDRADEWFPDMVDTDVVAIEGEVIRCGGTTKMPWPLPDRTWHVDTRAQVERIDGVDTWVATFEYVDGTGNLESLVGEYRLQHVDGGRTMVEYEASIDLGFWVPGPLVTWATNRVLPGILEGLESQSGSRTIARR